MTIYDAAMRYVKESTPLVVFAGKEYGTGSSRDWAAKGTRLLGVRAVITESFERIHRSNLVGMGVLPLQFLDGKTWKDLGLTGAETIDIPGIDGKLKPRQELSLRITYADGPQQQHRRALAYRYGRRDRLFRERRDSSLCFARSGEGRVRQKRHWFVTRQ